MTGFNPKEKLTFEKVVEGGYCIGCGACTAVSSSPIEIYMNEYGQYQAKLKREINQLEDQELMQVCPFSSLGPNEDQLAKELYKKSSEYNSYLGYYIACYAGYVSEEDYRENGSSGGMGTWILQELITKGYIDKVVHVKESKNKNDRLFEYSVSSSVDEIKKGAKSRYYPVEMSGVLNFIRNNPGKYAIVGVPCFIKAIRLLCKTDPIYADRIKYCVGLVCGHLKSKYFADMISMQMGFTNERIISLNFRKKMLDRRADDYGVEIIGTDEFGNEKCVIKPTKELYGTNWGHGLFKYNACDYCDDVLAETADITVGDAWLPKFVSDSMGTNIVVVRNKTINKLIQSSIREGRLNLINLPADEVIKSQAGGIRHRREGLAYRLYLKDERGEWRPSKRVSPSNGLKKKRQMIYKMRVDLVHKSYDAFLKAKQMNNFQLFITEMNPIITKYNKISRQLLWIRLFVKAKRMIKALVFNSNYIR